MQRKILEGFKEWLHAVYQFGFIRSETVGRPILEQVIAVLRKFWQALPTACSCQLSVVRVGKTRRVELRSERGPSI